MPTRITLNPLPATLTGYSQVPVSGTVQVQAPDQTWLPADCAFVEIRGNSVDSQSVTATGADGTFTGLLNVEDTGPFQARTYPSQLSFSEAAVSASQSAQIIPGQTRATSFAPAVTPEVAQDGLSFTARSQALATGPTGSVWVNDTLEGQLWFRPAGTSTWTLEATAPLSGAPLTAIPGYLPDGQPAEGYWQVRTLATPILQASASPIITVPVKVRTWLNDTTITTSGTRPHLTGTLDDQPAAGPLRGQEVRLSYRLPGTHTWHYVATTLTGAHGKFTFPITATGRWYRARYTGHGYYLPATSHSIYQP